MSSVDVGILGLVILFVLLLLRMPVGLAMGLVGFAGYAYLTSLKGAYGVLKTVPFSNVASYDLSVLPLFLFMGSLAYVSGLSESLYRAAYRWIGGVRGGLAMATVLGCAGFSALCGSTLATASAMGRIALPEMKKYGYHPGLATGTIAASGSLGILIPPSSIFIIYGMLTEQSITKLFMAGVFPGILLSFLFMLQIYARVSMNPKLGPPGPKTSWAEKADAIKDAGALLALVVILLLGLYLGWFTPTEAAGIGAFGVLVFGLIKRGVTRQNLLEALVDATLSTAMIFVIIIGAMIFSNFLAVSRLPSELAAFVGGLPASRYVIFLGIIIVYVILGCIMDSLAMVLLTVPIFYPLVTALGFDPIWFGVVVVLVAEMGVITPPVGMNVYVVRGIAQDVPMGTIFSGAMPFFVMMIVCVILITVFPQIALFLPGLMGTQ
ncbi:MAG: TRAP transporter large permease [Clostridia bacterium]|jgi:tripartite ATP-independent transporter DctM subunit|nr:TRAP transporter large permease [Clostridia bacterium]MDH7573709.1 TRAP transporter large permease [Clostridia bacterium]